MAQSFIGKPISLVSHSDVRYRGILAGIDPAASTIQLSNVFSMGTESRRPPAEFIPPVQEPYQYIIFRASEVKDLAVDEPAPLRSVHDDPAVLAAPPPQPYQAPPQPPQPQPQPQPQPAPRRAAPVSSVHTASASLETVERALGDLRVSTRGSDRSRGRGPRAPRHAQQPHPLTVPTTDFDFASMNAKFDKAALAPDSAPAQSAPQSKPNGNGTDAPAPAAYDPSKSFFDSLSPTPAHPSAASPAASGATGAPRGRRGPREGRSRREEERERNVATFGEPGGAHAHSAAPAWPGASQGYTRRGSSQRGRRGFGAVVGPARV